MKDNDGKKKKEGARMSKIWKKVEREKESWKRKESEKIKYG